MWADLHHQAKFPLSSKVPRCKDQDWELWYSSFDSVRLAFNRLYHLCTTTNQRVALVTHRLTSLINNDNALIAGISQKGLPTSHVPICQPTSPSSSWQSCQAFTTMTTHRYSASLKRLPTSFSSSKGSVGARAGVWLGAKFGFLE